MVVTRHHAPTQQEPRASMLTGAGAYGGGGGALSGNHEGHGASAQEMVVVSPNSQEVAELPSECASRQGHCSVVLPYRQPSPETQRFIATWQGALPKNFYIITACVLGCALTIFIGILVPMLVIRRSANIHNAVVRAKEYDAVSAWASVLRDVMIEGFAATRALAGYSISTFPPLQTPTNASDSIPSDKITAYLKRFPRFASLIASKKPAVAIQAICPGGVIAMTHPHDPDTVGRDLMSPSDPTNRYKPSTRETAQSGRYAIVGPRRTTIASLKQIWVIFTRAPLYRNTSKGVIPSQETFWGFVLLVVNVTGALDVMDLDKLAKDHNLDYVLYDTSTESGDTHVIASSLPSGAMQPDYEEFVAESTVTDVLAPHSSLHIAVRSRETYVSLTPTNIILIVVWTLFGSLLLLGISIAAVLWCTATYDAAAHAPKMAPFAMLTIGPCRGEELWDLATDQMAEVTEKLDQVLVRQMERHRAYQIQQVHPLTTSYVTRSVAAAVQMAFSTIEELQRHPIDGPLRAVLGDEVRLLLCYAVHWCTDAAVRVESLEGTYRYEGCDVVFGGRMWAFAAPSVVTASEAVVQTLPCFGLSGVVTRAYQTVDVMRTTRASYTDGSEAGISDASSTIGGGGSATLYLLVHAAKPDLVAGAEATAAAAAAVAMVPQLMVGNAPAPSLYCGLITRGNSPSLEAGRAAVPSLQDVSARSPEIESSASSAWSSAASTKGSSRATNASQRRGRAAAERSARTRNPLSRGDLDTEQQALVRKQALAKHNAASTLEQHRLVLIEADAVTRALLQPLIPRALDVALRVAFDYQSITLDVRYAEVRVLVYYFYSSYKILFRPLAAPERHNIFRRLVTAFGVPQQGILEHLAARGAVQWLSQVRKINGFMHRQGSLECSSQTESSSVTPSPCNSLPGAQRLRL
ncbi:conserved hypothetical protein [Leishmania infantum JPCM5]|uniref:Uncharacterized protein n=2 Tax=Leishmania infantum TaxID=5671 RepID=A4HTU4_LEIIN|nr:conserved hypothetical protein [Leishmania infantum JPCM5]CAC9453519.1 hypothetical_protein_-__conserved [Leishmania infantum]CAM65850.1 conserved hypothetical protein [Leishmania infantum JPCM5]SUZ39483.1 hypothetical_protein_-__conserved [Leishmania infantum]|eukprot:XP_001463485.1 conserved hypothetical protein [Leishmania infantum JPCM5]